MDNSHEPEMYAMIRRYEAAKAAKIGSNVQCPTCGNWHKKTTYHKSFCSNVRTHGRNNCKDRFWNFPGMALQLHKIKKQKDPAAIR